MTAQHWACACSSTSPCLSLLEPGVRGRQFQPVPVLASSGSSQFKTPVARTCVAVQPVPLLLISALLVPVRFCRWLLDTNKTMSGLNAGLNLFPALAPRFFAASDLLPVSLVYVIPTWGIYIPSTCQELRSLVHSSMNIVRSTVQLIDSFSQGGFNISGIRFLAAAVFGRRHWQSFEFRKVHFRQGHIPSASSQRNLNFAQIKCCMSTDSMRNGLGHSHGLCYGLRLGRGHIHGQGLGNGV